MLWMVSFYLPKQALNIAIMKWYLQRECAILKMVQDIFANAHAEMLVTSFLIPVLPVNRNNSPAAYPLYAGEIFLLCHDCSHTNKPLSA